MEEGRKKIRMCLIFVVTAAVIIGLIYYFHDVKGNHGVNEGTLIRRTEQLIEEKNEQMRFVLSDNRIEEEIRMKSVISDNGCGGGKTWQENQAQYI